MTERIDVSIVNCISETKLDDTFPSSNFFIPGYSAPYRLDRSGNGGGILIYGRDDIPSKELKLIPIPKNMEGMFIEINLYKKKWLIGNFYNPCKSMICSHLTFLSKCLDHYLQSYDNVILLGDFNSEPTEIAMHEFCQLYNLLNLIKVPTCFKNPQNPSCIDLILTNRHNGFQNSIAIETGLSDFHKMTITVLKTTYKKKTPKIVSYRDYKNFSEEYFFSELNSALYRYDIDCIEYDVFDNIFMELLNIHAPIKLKYVRANDGPFMTKELRKAIMLRSRLKTVFNRDKNEESKLAYTKQRNKCTNLLRKSKRNFYSNLYPRFVSDTKTFWKTVKPFFSEKISSNENIVLIEKDEIISEDNRISEIFNDFFHNAVASLNVDIDPGLLLNADHIDDPVLKAIERYKKHPSIIKIKEAREISKISMMFEFNFITMHEISLEIIGINSNKSNPIVSIPAKMIKENSSFFYSLLYNNFNNCISMCTFPSKLKLADVSPLHKKGVRMDKSNYRPVSILPAISKIYERVLCTQMNCFTENILSKFQCGFRKGTSAQHCLIVMLEKWKKAVDMKGCAGALLTDLSKAFDCISHNCKASGIWFSSQCFEAITQLPQR